ncbi:hypothetical protein, partial [Streptomyces reticuliscabiei]|uniref:hypothetical protein n=1 Tax=Streptomyces reticuliscabiei TaxID=146821 RepID=UPI0015C518F6
DDLEGGEVVQEELTAAAARRYDSSVAVAHGDDGVQFVDALGGRRADEDQFGAGAAAAMVWLSPRQRRPAPGTAGSSQR